MRLCTHNSGPACDDVEKLVALIENGMSIARFNMSHTSHKVYMCVAIGVCTSACI